MALRRLIAALLAVVWLASAATPAAAAYDDRRPSFRNGMAQFLGGLFLEFPKTVAEATVTGPPVAGTVVGILAGASQAGQMMVRGLREMHRGFDPWGIRED